MTGRANGNGGELQSLSVNASAWVDIYINVNSASPLTLTQARDNFARELNVKSSTANPSVKLQETEVDIYKCQTMSNGGAKLAL